MALNPQNLRDYNGLTEEEKREWHSKGGTVSAQKKRARKTFAETLRAVLASEYPVEDAKKKLQSMGLDGTWMDQLSQAQVDKASRGDTEAFRAVRDTIGENPKQAVDVGLTSGPVSGMDLTQLSDDQLRAMIAAREEADEND